MWPFKFANLRLLRLQLWNFSGSLALAITLASCSSVEAPLAIRMYNPKTNQTLHCTARSESSEFNAVLAQTVEACAQHLEANGFVRDN